MVKGWWSSLHIVQKTTLRYANVLELADKIVSKTIARESVRDRSPSFAPNKVNNRDCHLAMCDTKTLLIQGSPLRSEYINTVPLLIIGSCCSLRWLASCIQSEGAS